ncbi:DUF2778 domain-containing protein [Microvirga yunnanensis]|uniref:DUF2778 domain-containing protein n=1 Tax=Microvirga yunnanensis TaxID=2953740 RepID=UPI0021C66066|nr:DUF2778 domain-containing protein [Microvirga sp. HBU65207]
MLLMPYSSGRRAQRHLVLTVALVATLMSSAAYLADLALFGDAPVVASSGPDNPPRPAQEFTTGTFASADSRPLISFAPAMSLETFDLVHNTPLAPKFSQLIAQYDADLKPQPALAAAASSGSSVEPDRLPSNLAAMADPIEPTPEPIPLPVPRPPELRAPAPRLPEAPRSSRGAAPVPRTSATVAGEPDDRTFLEKLFGAKPAAPSASALGYASLGSGTGNIAPGAPLTPPPNSTESAATAVYDISAKVVSMPNGERLEAHSGLGDKLDDPRYVHVSMRGATPPGTYELTEREKLFHGVRALRMNPVGGNAAIYGRVGLLAHTYMLGPKGDSNGCVSFKDYDRFLQAYLRGEVKRLVVVLGRGQDVLPRVANADIGK